MLYFLTAKKKKTSRILAKQEWSWDQTRNLTHRNPKQSSTAQATPADYSIQILGLHNRPEQSLPIPPARGGLP